MIKTIARMSTVAVALAVLAAPATQMYASTPPPPTVVTGGDPQPTGEAVPTILILPSLVVL